MKRTVPRAAAVASLVLVVLAAGPARAQTPNGCARLLTADVVVLDQPLMFNRLGAQNVNGIVYALRRDVIALDPAAGIVKGNVRLRPDKRPRPLVLRVAAGDCLRVNFQNLLADDANPFDAAPGVKVDDQVASRMAGFHAQGMQVVNGTGDDASFVGKNPSSLVGPGGSTQYTLFAEKEGAFLVTSHGATFGGEGTAGNNGSGMFAVINVEPAGARFYRSQVTEEELRLATVETTADGQPILDYEAIYPSTESVTAADGTVTTVPSVWAKEGKGGLPVLNVLSGNAIVHSDLNAVIAGPRDDGSFPATTYPLESVGLRNPTVPNRLEPFREYTVVFHDEMASANAFPQWFLDPVLKHTLSAVGDVFMVNYGSGGVGSEVIANRLGVGPMHDCLDCVYEEFFLTSPAVGDPAMVVDVPANQGLEGCSPNSAASCPLAARGPKATRAYYPDDPSNVHHSYTGDFVKFRNVHTGKEHHVFHLHNHQWLFNPNDDNSNYLDAQGIGPGAGYTYEINFGGSGNRNKSAGDAIFHCHFYPHFAQGMWELWRNHDVLETGTPLEVSGGGYHATPFALQDGTPAPATTQVVTIPDPRNRAATVDVPAWRARALPDGEIVAGTPIPAVVPLPGKPIAVMPGAVAVVPKISNGVTVGSNAKVARPVLDATQALVIDTATGKPTCDISAPGTCADPALRDVLKKTPAGNPLNPNGLKNPGFPFWIAGVEQTIGQRNATPPLDMFAADGGWDGGLPRHALDGFAAAGCTDPANRNACATSVQTRLDMTKELRKAAPVWFPEDGTDVERAVMAFHAVRKHATSAVAFDKTATPADFITNGSGRPVSGAPFHEPCIDDVGEVWKGSGGSWFSATGLSSLGAASTFTAEHPRRYQGVNIQFDAVLNKLGYHYPQQRITTLWGDALATINKDRPPEPLVMRMNTFDCVMYQHSNLVPSTFELDDYQIKTTTDIIGQHIHLPKWDLTTTDGSANGWNYEDGTLSPDSVRERITAINAFNPGGGGNPANSSGSGANTLLRPLKHPFFPAESPGKVSWLGARTTLERWFSDPVVNVDSTHRGLGIIFTHDHFGPSTHQQIGLYATVLVEPPGSTWYHSETGARLYDGTRADGGPTSWQAQVVPPDVSQSYREFYFEYTDFQHAYEPGVYVGRAQLGGLAAGPDATTYKSAVNPSVKQQLSKVFPDLFVLASSCPGGMPRPCPEAISADDPGYLVVNYRNEPLAHRVYDPAKVGPDGVRGMQADGPAGDLAFALQSRTDRKLAALNVQPAKGASLNGTTFPRPINSGGVGPGDPFTPMMRAYFGDNVRVKVQAGGDEESHNPTIYGTKWLQGGSGYGFAPNSGWRASQHAGISEQFSFAAPALPLLGSSANTADHLYAMNASMDGFWNGVWGIMRNYARLRSDLAPLPNNQPNKTTGAITVANGAKYSGACPVTSPSRPFDVTAVLANDVLGNAFGVTIVPNDGSERMNAGATKSGVTTLSAAGGTLVHNPRQGARGQGPLHDPTAILYVMTSDLVARNPADKACLTTKGVLDPTLTTCPVMLKAGAPMEPIVLRAAADDCVQVTLRNRLPALLPDLAGYKHLPGILARNKNDAQGVTTFNNNLIRPSSYVGLHAQLVAYDVNLGDGVIVGTNGKPAVDGMGLLAPPGGLVRFKWYAGDLSLRPSSTQGSYDIVATPIEFGGANLSPADVMKQGQKGLAGAIVIEPKAAVWSETDSVVDRQAIANGTSDTCSGTTDPTKCRRTRAAVTVNGGVRDLVAVVLKGQNHRYRDGRPVEQLAAEGLAVGEDAEDSGQESINYGSEPMWFRFGLTPSAPFGNTPGGYGNVSTAWQAYSNDLVGGDPATPVFTAPAGVETRLHVVQPTGANRASTFTLHGHLWQRDPYICPGSSKDGLAGRCLATGYYPTASTSTEVASRAIGHNPLGIVMGAQDQVMAAAHFTLRLPKAGGAFARPGDYLFMDRSGFGATGGLWSILRVQ